MIRICLLACLGLLFSSFWLFAQPQPDAASPAPKDPFEGEFQKYLVNRQAAGNSDQFLVKNAPHRFGEWKTGAEKGSRIAQYFYGLCLQGGHSTAKDPDRAKIYLQKAADAGLPQALTVLGLVEAPGVSYVQGFFRFRNDQKSYERFCKAADMGDTAAIYFSALYQLYGFGCTKNEETAFKRIVAAANLGESNAMLLLGTLYGNGVYAKQDFNQANDWIRKAAELGNGNAMFSMCMSYENGYGVPKDSKEAAKWCLKAAELGNIEAAGYLGWMYEVGEGLPVDVKLAWKWHFRAAEAGHVEAMYAVARSYDEGNGVQRDGKEAVNWCQKAARLGDTDAIAVLGAWHQTGRNDLPKDFKYARILLETAAARGSGFAMCCLGNLYCIGQGVERSDREAHKWYLKAAQANYSPIYYYLSQTYFFARGIEKNYQESFRWCKKSVEADNPNAMMFLGYLYENGLGTEKDDAAAVKWYQAAAEKNESMAMLYLGKRYFYGNGVKKDVQASIKWLEKSSDLKNPYSMISLADYHEQGIGGLNDEKLAERLRRDAIKLLKQRIGDEDDDAMVTLGLLYWQGRGVEQNVNEAFALFRKAAKLGNQYALDYLIWLGLDS